MYVTRMDGTRIRNFHERTSWKTATWKTEKIRNNILKMNHGTQVVGITDVPNWFRIMCCYRSLTTVVSKRPYLEMGSFTFGNLSWKFSDLLKFMYRYECVRKSSSLSLVLLISLVLMSIQPIYFFRNNFAKFGL